MWSHTFMLQLWSFPFSLAEILRRVHYLRTRLPKLLGVGGGGCRGFRYLGTGVLDCKELCI